MWLPYYCSPYSPYPGSGGNDAAIICDDVDIDEVAPKVR